ncbi:hypothetical protein [Sphingomonas sp. NFR15]|uniref:hypothetical protein n=1 Tax=Sphingomonas sp. NFR15 TaxID=1566282 RepID=UPI00115FD3B9|nr:hypothetical protein [Sphingomonas sp. NFR15]
MRPAVPLLSSSTAKRQTLVVFHGTLASLLRSAGEQAQTPGEFRLAVTLDANTYMTVLKNPLLESAIIESVGKKIVTDVAPKLAQYYRANGRVSEIATPLQEAISLAPKWVEEVYNQYAPAIALWRKSRREQSLAVLKNLLSVGTATAGIVSAAPTFGATSIPAVYALWSATSELVGTLQVAWRSVTEAEAAVLAEARAIDQYFKSQNSALDHLEPTPGIKRASPINPASFPSQAANPASPSLAPVGWAKAAAFGKNAAGTVATALGAGPAMSAVGISAGPSVARFKSAMQQYEVKLAHLVSEANSLTKLLMEILVQNEQLSHSLAPGDMNKLKAGEARVQQIIGTETGGGISRARHGFRGKISILWLVAYAERGKELAVSLRTDMASRLETSGLNQLRGSEAAITFAITLAKWCVDNREALGSTSLVEFGQAMKILSDDGAVQFKGIADAKMTLMEWKAGCQDVIDAFKKDGADLQGSDLIEEIKIDYKEDFNGYKEIYAGAKELKESIKEAMSPA